MKNESKAPFIGEMGIDVREVVERMRTLKQGESVGYRELTQLIGRDVTVHRHICDSARRILMRDHNMVFRAVMNEGFKRLDDAEVVDVVTTGRRNKIRKQAAVAVRELTTVAYEALGDSHQKRHNTGLALFGALFHATSKASVRRLGERVANAGGRIDAKGTLKLIGWLAD